MAATALKPIGHEDRLTLVDHLDELRTRIIICVVAFVVAFGLCAWQNGVLLDVINVPLEETAFKKGTGSKDPFEQTARLQQQTKTFALGVERYARGQARGAETPRDQSSAAALALQARALAAAVPPRQAKRPVTLGVGEPFTATIRVAAWAAVLFSLPLLLYQLYAFVLPAFSPRERQVALPLMLMVPLLFIAGVVFAYFVVLPKAIDFLQNFNDDKFDILLQARDYYKFSIMVLIAMGLAFQVPIGILAVTRVGIVSVRQLRKNRRYAILVIAVLAMLAPGQDPVTMLLIMAPLYVLFEGSILFAALLDRRAAKREEAEAAAAEDHDDDELLPLDSDHD